MLKKGDLPYWNEIQYEIALKSCADIIILMLGTNDSKIQNWNLEDFEAD